jgi:hypothetical protein
MADGATPQDAFGAAMGAAESTAADLGVPADAFEQGSTAATEAFNDAIDGGASPGDAMQAAGNAAQTTFQTPGPPPGGEAGFDMGAAAPEGGDLGITPVDPPPEGNVPPEDTGLQHPPPPPGGEGPPPPPEGEDMAHMDEAMSDHMDHAAAEDAPDPGDGPPPDAPEGGDVPDAPDAGGADMPDDVG